jgi:TIR domain
VIRAELSPKTLRAGVASDVVIMLHNTGTGSCINVTLQMRLPHELVLEYGQGLVEIPRLGPGQRHELAIKLLPRREGRWTITIPNFSFTDPTGRSRRFRDESWKIDVLPGQPRVIPHEDPPLKQPKPANRHDEAIFISYRECEPESDFAAGWLYDSLRARLRTGTVFWNKSLIEPGEDFMKRLNAELAKCTSLLAVIGPKWLEIIEQRLNNDDDDFVRHEITVALERNVRIIPVLINEAKMPTYRKLPEGLREFAYKNGISVEPGQFDAAVSKIILTLRHGPA